MVRKRSCGSLANKIQGNYPVYKEQRMILKGKVKEAKQQAWEEFGQRE